MKRGKTAAIFLTCLFVAASVIGFAACGGSPTGGDPPPAKKYTVVWKNYDGEILQSGEVEEGTLPVYTAATPTRESEPNAVYVFDGWVPQVVEVTQDAVYTATFAKKTQADDVVACDAPRVSQDNKTVTYGRYPQTRVKDDALIGALSTLTPHSNGWYWYEGNYYAKQTATVFSGEAYTFDDGTDIVNGTEYWFKCEEITWQILSNLDGTYFLLSQTLLDTGCFYADYVDRAVNGELIYANNYEQSGIRKWLNNTFLDLAFTNNVGYISDSEVSNAASTTQSQSNTFACKDTVDKVFLPSYRDYLTASYGFDTDPSQTSAGRTCKTTDYARAKGAWYNTKDGLKYNGSYWTRSPSSEYSYCAMNVNSAGFLSAYAVDGVSHCVRPCIRISL